MNPFQEVLYEQEKHVPFSDDHLNKLRTEYSKIKTVDPSGESYKKLTSHLDSLHPKHLEQLAGAKIPFVSGLARNRVGKKNECVEDADAQVLKEENQLDELKSTTLGSYVKKATQSYANKEGVRSDMAKYKSPNHDTYKKEVAKRKAGIDRATDKLTKRAATTDHLKFKGIDDSVEYDGEMQTEAWSSYRAKGSARESGKPKWMADFEKHVVAHDEKHRGKIEWDSAHYFHNTGHSPEEAAKKYVSSRNESLDESKFVVTPELKHKITVYQAQNKVTWDQAKKHFEDAHNDAVKAAKQALKASKPKTPRPAKEKLMTTRDFEKTLRGAAKDFKGDNPDVEMDQVAWDLADALLWNPDIRNYVASKLRTTNREVMKEYIADRLPESVETDGVEQIDELKKSTLLSYIGKSVQDVGAAGAQTREFANRSRDSRAQDKHNQARAEMEKSDKSFARGWKRKKGVELAAAKLAAGKTTNEELIDEKTFMIASPAMKKAKEAARKATEAKNASWKFKKGVKESEAFKEIAQRLIEKTLTSAEQDKREDVAQAMERENPGMDMGKKMAIATAVAKRTAESIEEGAFAPSHTPKQHNPLVTLYDKDKKMMGHTLLSTAASIHGFVDHRAHDVLKKNQGKMTKVGDIHIEFSPHNKKYGVTLGEEASHEDLNEDAQKVYNHWQSVRKAGNGFYTIQAATRHVMGDKDHNPDEIHRDVNRILKSKQKENEEKRRSGKTNESEQIDELNAETLASYKKKAGAHATALDSLAKGAYERGEKKTGEGLTQYANKRFSGILRATRQEFKKANEDVNEAEFTGYYFDKGGKSVNMTFTAPNITQAKAKVKAAAKEHGGRYGDAREKSSVPLHMLKPDPTPVKEEAIDEISKQKVTKYVNKAYDDMEDAIDKGDEKREFKRAMGVQRAHTKLDKTDEAVVNELSKTTLASYIDKTHGDIAKQYNDKNRRKLSNRLRGTGLAHKKLQKEEVEVIDELNADTLQSYKDKAEKQVKEVKPWTKKGEYKDIAKRIVARRERGIASVKSRNNESVEEINEVDYKKNIPRGEVGDTVMIHNKNMPQSTGTITKVNGDSYHIQYNAKRSEKNVPHERIARLTKRVSEGEINEVKVGDKVHVGINHKGGAGFTGTVQKIEDDKVHVKSNQPEGRFGGRTFVGHKKNVTVESEEWSDDGVLVESDNEDFNKKLDSHLKGIEKIHADYRKRNGFTHGEPKFSAQHGKKYVKIVRDDGQRSVHSFIDKTTGDVLKPASWNAPAKHARGNIHDEHNGLKHMGPHGPAYLK
jgi:hypothetical protein